MQLRVSSHDSGFLFGEGVFRTLKVVDGKVPHWQEHLAKLREDCRFLSLPLPTISEQDVQNFVAENQAEKGTWRLKIICTQSLFVTLEPYTLPSVPKRLTIYPHCIEKPSVKIKSLSYLDNLLVSKYATACNYDDALILNHEKAILECSKANFLWIYKDILHFTDPALPYYEGVTQALCFKAALQLGLKLQPCRCRVHDLPAEAHLFTANAMQGLVPIIQVENRIFERDLSLEKKLSMDTGL